MDEPTKQKIFNKYKGLIVSTADVFWNTMKNSNKPKDFSKEDFIQLSFLQIWLSIDSLDENRTKGQKIRYIQTCVKNNLINIINRYKTRKINTVPIDDTNTNQIESKPIPNQHVFSLNFDEMTKKEQEFCILLMEGNSIIKARKKMGWSPSESKIILNRLKNILEEPK